MVRHVAFSRIPGRGGWKRSFAEGPSLKGRAMVIRRIKKVQKRINQIAPQKNKFDNTNFASTNAASSPDVTGAIGYTQLCQPSQGTTIINRTGDRLRMRSMKFHVELQKTDQNLYRSGVRMIIIYDHENSFSNATQLLNTTSIDGGIYSDLAQNERPRYTLLRDHLFTWPPSTYNLAGGTLSTQSKTIRINLKDKLVTFTSGGTAVYHGALKVFFLSPDAAGAGTTRIAFNSDVYFNDVL